MTRSSVAGRRTTLPLLAVVLAVVLSTLVASPPVRAAAEPAPTTPVVSPPPRSLQLTGGQLRVPQLVALVTGGHSDPAAVREVVGVLRAAGATEFVPATDGRARLTVYLGGPAEHRGAPGFPRLPARVNALPDLPSGGYLLASAGQGSRWALVLAGVDGAGQYYAAQTLRQVLRPVPGPDLLPGLVVLDWPGLADRGVIEGFYGPPWSHADRLRVLDFHGRHKLNTYVYAPKDDPYHRERWREPYPAQRLAEFRELAARAADGHVDLVFAVSPGADICYSGAEDFRLLTAKAQALHETGVRSFALFFDDIDAQLDCAEDLTRFGTDPSPTAAAQAHLLDRFTDEFLATHPGAGPLLTVPTEYNGVAVTPYKQRFAELTPADTQVMWTGQQVISPTITDQDLAAARGLYRHPLVVWDNYPVNDAQPDRLYLGPLTGRGPRPADNGAAGLLANPMVQAEPSRLALATIADYGWNPAGYQPERSWRAALHALGGEHSEQLAAFADANRSSPLDARPAPVLAERIAEFETALVDGRPREAADPLVRQFSHLAEARSAIGELDGELDGPAFVAAADPWLRKANQYGTGGAAIVRSLTAEQAGELTTAWQQRTVFERAVTEAARIPQTVAPGVVDPFFERAAEASDLVELTAPLAGEVIAPGSDLTLTASVRSGSVPIESVRFLVGDTVIGTVNSAPYQVVWHDVPRRLARTVVEVTDVTGAVVRSTPVNLTIGTPDRALLVYGDDGNPGTGGLAAGELDVLDRLEHLGLAVDPIPAKQVQTPDATGKAVVLVSSTVASGDVGAKFRDVPVPVIGWEAFVFDDMAMAATAGEEFRTRAVRFTDPPTPLSAGLSGEVDVYRQDGRIRWAVPEDTAIVAATMPDDPTLATLFGYQRGAAMVGGFAAPARRVGLFLGDEGLLVGLVDEASVRVFDTAVRWSLGAA